jgi:hypothetical protein
MVGMTFAAEVLAVDSGVGCTATAVGSSIGGMAVGVGTGVLELQAQIKSASRIYKSCSL